MTDGLITRIGKWIDHKWQSKATESMVIERWNSLENAAIQDKLALEQKIVELRALVVQRMETLSTTLVVTPKEFADLKERLGHLEVYVGMKRVVDPAKPAVAKSAFAM